MSVKKANGEYRGSIEPLQSIVDDFVIPGRSGRDDKPMLEKTACALGFDIGFCYTGNQALGDEFYLLDSFGDMALRGEIEKSRLSNAARRGYGDLIACLEGEVFVGGVEADVALAAFPIFDEDCLIGVVGLASSTGACPNDRDYLLARIALSLIGADVRSRYDRQRRDHFRNSLERAVDSAGVDIYVVDFYTHEILYMNKSMAAPYGTPEELLGRRCYEVLYQNRFEECDFCPKKKLIDENGNPTRLYSWDYQRPFDGSWFRVFSAAFKWEGDKLAHVITSTNITENKNNELLIEKMAMFDALTSVPNRRSFEINFQRMIDAALRENKTGFILFVDLDNFKHINDAFGHEKGDELLICVAGYLDSFSSEHQQVYRYGGDEFIILIEDQDREAVRDLVDSFLLRFAEPWDLDGLEYFCTASIGAASFPFDGVTYDVLLNAADKAMYEAKKQGKSTAVFSQGGAERRPEAMEFEFALRRAVLDGCGEFEVLFHPIVDIHTGRWAGVEALARWNSQIYGTVGPDRFIPVCEKLGLIFDIEKWLLASAIGEVASWTSKPADLFLSFNVSAMEFCGDGFADYLLSVADEKGYPHRRLMLEIAESPPDLNLRIADIKNRLDYLRGRGVAVALDGFGIGYDSLERVQELPVDFIKIDRKFVTDAAEDERKIAIVQAIVILARAAQAKVCAEGVERAEHLDCLKRVGCDYVQGRYYHRPASGPEILDALNANREQLESLTG